MKLAFWLFTCLLSCEASQVKGKNGNIFGGVIKRTEGSERIEEAKVKPDIFEINKGINGLIHGDVIPGKKSRNTIVDPTLFWPTTTIPYQFSNTTLYGVDLEGVAAIQLAIQEYKLRTCMNFVQQTTETNYVIFEKRSGCYSNVGTIGGAQTISIGSGCQHMSTVCHEMMHAIGIWHEQSRADRDNYVEIMWDVIESGTEYNFDKYTWDETDARRVPYDYYSVMHYSDTGFSTNGDPTIVTRNPAFQDVIGQRKTFSRRDSTKINRMYGCGDTILYSYNCNYDDEADCGYVQDFDSDDVDWIRYDVGDKSVTVSPYSPNFDSTVGVAGEGSYMILDTSGKQSGMSAEMRSMRFVSKSQEQCLQFSFYLDRVFSSTASFAVYIGSVDENDETTVDLGNPIVTLDSDYGNTWHIERMTINAPEKYRLVFVGNTDVYSNDVVAVDDVSVQDKPCEDGYFVVEQYSNVVDTYQKGDYLFSPVMTSTQGYNFQLLVYPKGYSTATYGYMSVFFGIVQGPNDDNLDWPFCNKYIRVMVVDQDKNPLYAMHSYQSFLTSQTSGGAFWNKPTSSNAVGYWGYSDFMKVSDIQNTYNYIKNDALMISVLVKDMNFYNGEVCRGSFTRSSDEPAPVEYRTLDSGYDWEDHGHGNGDGDKGGDEHGKGDCRDGHCEDQDHSNAHGSGDQHHLTTESSTTTATITTTTTILPFPNTHVPVEGTTEEEEHHHNGDHEENEDVETIPIGTAVGIAAATGLAVFFVMTCVLICVVKSYKRSASKVSTNIVMHASKDHPPPYAEEKVTIEPLAMPKV